MRTNTPDSSPRERLHELKLIHDCERLHDSFRVDARLPSAGQSSWQAAAAPRCGVAPHGFRRGQSHRRHYHSRSSSSVSSLCLVRSCSSLVWSQEASWQITRSTLNRFEWVSVPEKFYVSAFDPVHHTREMLPLYLVKCGSAGGVVATAVSRWATVLRWTPQRSSSSTSVAERRRLSFSQSVLPAWRIKSIVLSLSLFFSIDLLLSSSITPPLCQSFFSFHMILPTVAFFLLQDRLHRFVQLWFF